MSDPVNTPLTSPLKFTRSKQTALNFGEYTIRASQSVTVKGHTDTFTRERTFMVVGPRFVLASDQVASVFPPPNTNGDYNNFVPYIVIRRATLPWERQICAGNDDPFLALLIVSEAELASGVCIKPQRVADFRTQRGLPAEMSDDPDASMRVVEAEIALLVELLPSLSKPSSANAGTCSELALLAHIRQRENAAEEAVILGNRRPLPNTRYAVHLVSLEGLDPNQLPTGKVALPSLYSWDFTSGADKIGLVERLEVLQCDALRLPERAEASSAYQALRRDGYVVMPYRMAWGDQTHALYRGPLLPVAITESVSVSCARAVGLDSSEGLVDYYGNLGLPDVSLAAAWELGRILMLRRRPAAMAYYRFRREQAGIAYQGANAAEQQHLVVSDVPPTQTDVLPSEVQAFCEELLLLRGVPFAYLLPDPRMLPDISLRVFQVDRRWLACLLGGALSLGRSRTVDVQREQVYLERLMSNVGASSGIFIRSPVVAERPNQAYEIYDQIVNGQRSLLTLRRQEQAAADVLMVMVEGVLQGIWAGEEARTAHFGFKEGGSSGQEYFEKDLRNPNDFTEIGTSVQLDSSHYRNSAKGILDLAALANSFYAQSPSIERYSEHFALQLIESGARAISIPLGGISS